MTNFLSSLDYEQFIQFGSSFAVVGAAVGLSLSILYTLFERQTKRRIMMKELAELKKKLVATEHELEITKQQLTVYQDYAGMLMVPMPLKENTEVLKIEIRDTAGIQQKLEKLSKELEELRSTTKGLK